MATVHNDGVIQVSYLGEFPNRVVDRSHRLLVPIEWRPKGATICFILLMWPLDVPECLWMFPPESWKAYWAQWQQHSTPNEERPNYVRVLGRRAFPVSLDPFGRLPLPEKAASAVGIKDQATLIGVDSRIEIWNPDACEAALTNVDLGKVAQIFKQLRT